MQDSHLSSAIAECSSDMRSITGRRAELAGILSKHINEYPRVSFTKKQREQSDFVTVFLKKMQRMIENYEKIHFKTFFFNSKRTKALHFK